METVAQDAFSLHVDTPEFTRALKHLRKLGPHAELVRLSYGSGLLTISMGRTARDVRASGTWPRAVQVDRKWADALATKPVDAAIVSLRFADGKLYARDFAVPCKLGPSTEEDEVLAQRRDNVAAVCSILARHKVTAEEVSALIERADASVRRLWGPNDGRLVRDIAIAWEQLAVHGVEPSDIRRLTDRKSRELWKRKPSDDVWLPLARYHVTLHDLKALTESGNPAKAIDDFLIREVVHAWGRLVLYGVEPSEIRHLIDRKVRGKSE